MSLPRVLVVSSCSFSFSNSNGRTLSSFFAQWDIDSVAQLYIQPEIPNTTVCKNFYRVTDYEMLRAALTFGSAGRAIPPDEISQNPLADTRTDRGFEKMLFASSIRKRQLFHILRNMLWATNHWDHEGLHEWVTQFAPDVIFYQAGNNTFTDHIATKLASHYGIPLIVFNSEDYYIKNTRSYSPLVHLGRFIQRRSYRKLMGHTNHVIYSQDLLKADFDEIFPLPSSVLLTTSTITHIVEKAQHAVPVISYLGNIGHNRWKSLVRIGQALQAINPGYYVDVYSQQIDLAASQSLTTKEGVRFRGPVNYSDVVKIMQNSDLVLHVEDFSESTKRDIRHGFTTKIADCLSCGTCLFAYGPEGIAVIDYLKSNNVACVVTEEDQAEVHLRQILSNESLRDDYVGKALALARERHSAETNAQIFKRLVSTVVSESQGKAAK